MRSIKLQSLSRRLDALFEVAKTISDDELQSHFSKYLCIQVSGFLESVVKLLIEDYHDKTCKKETKNFVICKVSNITNLNSEKLEIFLQSFDITWKDQFQAKLTQQHTSSLDSIISQRNLIAHGRANTSNITLKSIQEYYSDLKVIVTELESIISK